MAVRPYEEEEEEEERSRARVKRKVGGGCRDGRVVGGGNGIIRNGEERE